MTGGLVRRSVLTLALVLLASASASAAAVRADGADSEAVQRQVLTADGEAFDYAAITDAGTLGLAEGSAEEQLFLETAVNGHRALPRAGSADAAAARFAQSHATATALGVFGKLKKIGAKVGRLALKAGKMAMKLKNFTPQGMAMHLGMKLAKKLGKKLLKKLGRKLRGKLQGVGRGGGKFGGKFGRVARRVGGRIKRWAKDQARGLLDGRGGSGGSGGGFGGAMSGPFGAIPPVLAAQLAAEKAAQDAARAEYRASHPSERDRAEADITANRVQVAAAEADRADGGRTESDVSEALRDGRVRQHGRGLRLSYVGDKPVMDDGSGMRFHSPEEIEDCMCCKYIMTQVEAEVGLNTGVSENVYDSFRRNARDAARTPICSAPVQMMWQAESDLVGDYIDRYSVDQICENSLLCRNS